MEFGFISRGILLLSIFCFWISHVVGFGNIAVIFSNYSPITHKERHRIHPVQSRLVYIFIYSFIHLFFHSFIYLFFLFIYSFIYPIVHLFICFLILLFIYLFICLFIHLCIVVLKQL